jgi:exopolysaccharide production protein ExoQ
MIPVIALFLCIFFIIFLFVLDKRNKGDSDTSWALWIPLLFMLISASRPIILWLKPGLSSALSADMSEGSPADLYFFIFLIISGAFILLKKKLNWAHIIKNNLWISLLFFYCGISIIWSDVPRASLNAWIKVMVFPMMALIIITEPNPLGSLKTVFKRTTYVLIPLSIVLIKYYPAYGRSYSPFTGVPFYGGVTTYKNGLGVLCMITGLFFAWDIINMFRDKTARLSKTPLLINIALIGMIIWLLIMASSATAIASFIVGVGILIALELTIIKSNLKYLSVIIFVVLFLALLSFSFGIFEGLVSSLGRDTTLTGRTVIWERVLGMGSNPIIGTGYSSFWLGERGEFLLDLNWQRLTQAHNGYIEVYLNLGLIGLGLLVLMIIKTYKNSENTLLTDFQYGKLQLMYITVFLLTNITEATFGIKSTSWFMFVLISLKYSSIEEHLS